MLSYLRQSVFSATWVQFLWELYGLFWFEIGPQMIPGRNRFNRKKLGMARTPWKKLWMDTYIFLIILGQEKTSTSDINAAIKKVKENAQNTKLICFSFRKHTLNINRNLERCFCYLINCIKLFPVHFLYLRPWSRAMGLHENGAQHCINRFIWGLFAGRDFSQARTGPFYNSSTVVLNVKGVCKANTLLYLFVIICNCV